MNNTNYYDLDLLTISISPAKSDLAQFISQVFTATQKRTLYYVDATNSFPLRDFQRIVKIGDNDIYDHIRITTCLDLPELSATVNKIVHILNLHKIERQQRRSGDKPSSAQGNDAGEHVEILLILRGLEIMFRNTQMKCSPSDSHLLLRDLLLRLRSIANNCDKGASMLRTLLIFPRDEIFRYNSTKSESTNNKRLKVNAISGNTLGEYVARFYADGII